MWMYRCGLGGRKGSVICDWLGEEVGVELGGGVQLQVSAVWRGGLGATRPSMETQTSCIPNIL